MKRKEWAEILSKLESGLSGAEIARRIKQPAQLTQYWIKKLNYESVDGRKSPLPSKFDRFRKVKAAEIDWSETNNQTIANKFGVSRNRIWQLRHQITKI